MTRKIQLSIILLIFISVGYAKRPQRVINGEDASITEVPHQVSLRTRTGGFLCSGSIIGPKLILTASHCLLNKTGMPITKDLYICSGTNEKYPTSSHHVYKVVRRISHGDIKDHLNNDIAILELNRPIVFDSFQAEAKLPNEEVPVGTRVMVSGWGATAYNTVTKKSSNSPKYLQKYYGNIISQEKCQAAVGNSMIIGPQHICVWQKYGSDACYGDSGGPLTYKGTVIGINSAGVECGQNYPAIFTRVHYYLKWIQIIKWSVQYKTSLSPSQHFVEI